MKKTCIKCNKEKEVTLFTPRKDSKDGYRNDCKDCVKKYNIIYNNNPVVKIKKIERGRVWKKNTKNK